MRRIALRPKHAAAAVVLAGAATAALMLLPLREPATAAVTLKLPDAKAAALVTATSGAALEDMQATGDQARVINAALPFANGPLHAAQRFVVSGSSLDQQRALLCLTQAVYYEAGFEPAEGRRAVAQVVLNRMRHPAFPKSICGVVYQGAGSGTCQFTFVCDGALYRRPAADAWRQAEAVARAALSGYVETSVGEATHYHADYVAPRWAPMLAKVAEIGQHIFYRWPGAWGQPSAFSGRYIGEPRDPLTMRPAMTVAMAPDDAISAAAALAETGPPIPRAPNDVGGLLDTSKGWTLHIPGPDESDGAAAKMIAAQKGISVPTREVAAASPIGAAAGSR
ncbi:MAG TPA: cell wall hydrolase [Sphingomicrobium sp.]|jgi:spore germination cell wall hydrolase CwlJ-like protein|nr:cell wall hydrolase [Sphingomicrobium sp.]